MLLGFGVGTPQAAQGAALKEYQSANPRSIMQGKPLNIENDPATIGIPNAG
jgi:hypothetical protein